MKNKKLTNILLCVFPALAALLNALPWRVRLQFKGDGEVFTDYFSGFSMIPWGYGLPSHMIAGVCAVALLAMGLLNARSDSVRLLKYMLIVSIVGLMMAATPFAFGTATAVSALVALAIGAEAAILYRLREDM